VDTAELFRDSSPEQDPPHGCGRLNLSKSGASRTDVPMPHFIHPEDVLVTFAFFIQAATSGVATVPPPSSPSVRAMVRLEPSASTGSYHPGTESRRGWQ
jgi:hypothetical protein